MPDSKEILDDLKAVKEAEKNLESKKKRLRMRRQEQQELQAQERRDKEREEIGRCIVLHHEPFTHEYLNLECGECHGTNFARIDSRDDLHSHVLCLKCKSIYPINRTLDRQYKSTWKRYFEGSLKLAPHEWKK